MRVLLSITSILCFWMNFAQDQPKNTDALITINKEEISVDEFMNVYNKNIQLIEDEDQKGIDNYLELFINYKLKIADAKSEGFDKKQSYLDEYEKYKNQLIDTYLLDKKVTSELLEEAYSRTKEEVKAQHILVRVTGQDTLSALNQIREFRARFLNESFETLKKSIHNGNAIFVENLGYFSAFKMVYDFENAAYNTPIGETSQPFKTQFGYHVVKVLDKRPSKGQAEAAHIMITNKSNDTEQTAEQRINELYRLIEQGESFENLAKQYSEDKSSAVNGGKLKPFKSGEINSELFVDTAFSLDVGAISNPIQTKYGWHIIKLLDKKPIESFEQLKFDLDKKVKRDSRSQVIKKRMLASIMNQYQVQAPKSNTISTFYKKNKDESGWILNESLSLENQLIKIKNRVLSYGDFLSFLNNNSKTKKSLEDHYNTFLENNVMQYKKDQLPFENAEYANVLREYEEGLLLFDIMEEKIWNRAKNDSLGLLEHYKSNASKFISPKNISGTIARSDKKSTLKKVKNLWDKNTSNDEVSKVVNAKNQNVIFSSGTFEIGSSLLPKNAVFETGISKIFDLDDSYVVLNILNQQPEKVLSFEDARGAVISSYQNLLEQNWIEALRAKFSFSVNQNVLNELKQKISNK
ncbi:MAG: peptidylprolyl isomerase [Bacteroidetes bacterium]|nr:peptidylprolyl isomerase [Bacteroidota bacterium]MDA0860910.1 peptidylprolyl isomerase [Bacteroidota bacterium]MDA1319172.1 peptidylprolyl isomerase [Bacteroidota bacterium]